MTKRKQCAALALALTLTISMFGCEKDKETTQSSAVSQIKTSDSAQPSNVKVKEYKFPEFLNKIKSLDELSRKLYTSFDSTQYVAEVEEQPFEEYKCEKLLADLFFTYRDGRAVGLLDKSGNVVLEADEYTEITVVSNGILQLSYDKERNAPMQYMKYDSDGNLSDYKHKKFSADSLYTYESQADDSSTDTVYSLMIPDGKNVVSSDGSDKWDSVEKISADSIDTNKADFAAQELCGEMFGDYVKTVVGSVKERRNKPYPDNVLFAMDKMGAEKSETVYVGDSEVDVETAKNSGLSVIAVLWGYRDIDVLKKAGAEKTAKNAEELKNILLNLKK